METCSYKINKTSLKKSENKKNWKYDISYMWSDYEKYSGVTISTEGFVIRFARPGKAFKRGVSQRHDSSVYGFNAGTVESSI